MSEEGATTKSKTMTPPHQDESSSKPPLTPHFPTSDALYYVPNFIPSQLSESLCHHINHSITYKKLLNRELVSYGPMVYSGGKSPVYLSHSIPLPSFMQKVIDSLHLNQLKKSLSQQRLPAPLNHILLNRYQTNQGILPHRDGPAYDPFVFILSLESPVRLDFVLDHMLLQKLPQEHQDQILHQIDNVHKIPHKFALVLDADSLIVFHSVVYEYFTHGIEETHQVSFEGVLNERQMREKYGGSSVKREQRSSLTIRTVKHVNNKMNKLFPGLMRK